MSESGAGESSTQIKKEAIPSDRSAVVLCSSVVSEYEIILSSSQWTKAMLDWEEVYAVSPPVGVNLQSPLFGIDHDDVHCVCLKYQSLEPANLKSHYNIANRNQVDHLSQILHFLITKDETGEKAILFSSLCKCKACDRKVDLLKAKPMAMNLELSYRNIKMPPTMIFYPGVTDNFDMKKDAELCQPENVIYFSEFFKISDFRWDPLPHNRRFKIDRPDETDVELVSSDGKRFLCHKAFLTAVSQVFADLLAQAGNDAKVYVPEVSTIVKPFFRCLYRGTFDLTTQLDLETLSRILKLALQYQLITIIAACTREVDTKLNSFTVKDLPVAQQLIKLLEDVDKYQTVVKLYNRLSSKPPRLTPEITNSEPT